MASKGLNYYQAETNRYCNIRTKKLKRRFGALGYVVFDYILNEIFRVGGCYVTWDEATSFDVSEYWGCTEEEVNAIVDYCADEGLFCRRLLDEHHVLSSVDIQEMYVEICKRSHRRPDVPQLYALTDNKSTDVKTKAADVKTNTADVDTEATNKRKGNTSYADADALDPRTTGIALASDTASMTARQQIDHWTTKLKDNTQWLVDTANQYMLPHDTFIRALDMFAEDKRTDCAAPIYLTEHDFVRHFKNWLSKKRHEYAGGKADHQTSKNNKKHADNRIDNNTECLLRGLTSAYVALTNGAEAASRNAQI